MRAVVPTPPPKGYPTGRSRSSPGFSTAQQPTNRSSLYGRPRFRTCPPGGKQARRRRPGGFVGLPASREGSSSAHAPDGSDPRAVADERGFEPPIARKRSSGSHHPACPKQRSEEHDIRLEDWCSTFAEPRKARRTSLTTLERSPCLPGVFPLVHCRRASRLMVSEDPLSRSAGPRRIARSNGEVANRSDPVIGLPSPCRQARRALSGR